MAYRPRAVIHWAKKCRFNPCLPLDDRHFPEGLLPARGHSLAGMHLAHVILPLGLPKFFSSPDKHSVVVGVEVEVFGDDGMEVHRDAFLRAQGAAGEPPGNMTRPGSVHPPVYTHKHPHAHTLTHAGTHIHSCTHIHTNSTCKHIYKHAHTHAYRNTYICTHTHVQTCLFTQTGAYTTCIHYTHVHCVHACIHIYAH